MAVSKRARQPSKAGKKKPRAGAGHMSIRVALRRMQEMARVEVRPLEGNFGIDGDDLTIGEDRYRLVKVPGDGDCAFDSMAFIVHCVLNRDEWRGPLDAYERTGLAGPAELRKALDAYRGGLPRDGGWGDQFDWVVFSAMFKVSVNVISYRVTEGGLGGETHSVIGPDVLGAKAYVPGFVRAGPGEGLHAYVCNHYDVHYDPMRLVARG